MTRIGLISDIHGNLPALERVVAALKQEGVDGVISCGDLVGYGPWPREVIELVRRLGWKSVQGNHDAATCGTLPTGHFNYLARRAIEWGQARLSPDDVSFLAGLPQTVTVEGMTVVHGSLRGPLWEYILDSWTAGESFRRLAGKIALFGHSHIQGGFVEESGKVRPIDPRIEELPLRPENRYLINPGSVGQPRDGDPRAAYAIIDLEERKVIYRRISYDISATQREIERVGLPPELGERLSIGR